MALASHPESHRPRVRFFLHVATLGRYEHIANETVAAILASPAMSTSDRIEIGVVGDGPLVLAAQDERITVTRNGPDVTAFEFPTLDMIHRSAAADPIGAIVYLNCLGGRYVGIDWEIRRRWRAMLHYLLLTNLDDCLTRLETHDICGVEWTALPLPHMTSNNWIADAGYIARLPAPDAFAERVVSMDLSRFGERWRDAMIKRRHAGEYWIGAARNVRACTLLPISRMGLPRSEFNSAPWWALPDIRWDRLAMRHRTGAGTRRERIVFAWQVARFNLLFLARTAKRRLRALLPARHPAEHSV